MGGSDQWGNIVSGVELGRRAAGLDLYGLTSPLLTTASGAKMGKTADGRRLAQPRSISTEYEYWQYWRNTEDADVGRFLRLFTELPLDEIARLEALEGAEINEAKAILATEATTLCHGREVAEEGGGDGEADIRRAGRSASDWRNRHSARRRSNRSADPPPQATDRAGAPILKAESSVGLPAFEIAQSRLDEGDPRSTTSCARLVSRRATARHAGSSVVAAPGSTTSGSTTRRGRWDRTTSHGEGAIKLSAGRKRHALVRVSQ